MIRDEVGKGAIYLYIQLITSMISGYIFLILLARITTTEIIGTFSLLVSISEIFANIAIIGLPDSIQRFVGKNLLQKRPSDAKLYVKIAFIFLSAGVITSCIVVLLLRDWLSNVFGIGYSLIIVVDLLICSYALFAVSYSIVVASLKTKVLPLIIIISSVAKVILSLSLVLMGSGVIGLALGYTFFGQIFASLLLGIVIFKMFTRTSKLSKTEITTKNAAKTLLTGGLVIWIPVLVTTLGIDLGTLVLYDINGSYQSGIYFLTLAIVNAVQAIVFSIFTISLPALSSMTDGRKRFTWQTIRLSAVIVLPLSFSLIFYSKEVLRLIGTNYVEGAFSMQMLLLSTFPMIILTGVETLVYSYGQYRHTLAINFASSIPRTFLYFILVPLFGISGVAISYTAGSIIGFIVSIVIANKIKLHIFWKRLALALFFPVLVAFILATLNVNYIIGIVATIIISTVLFMKFHIIEKLDGLFFINLMPTKISRPLLAVSTKLEKVIDWFYG